MATGLFSAIEDSKSPYTYLPLYEAAARYGISFSTQKQDQFADVLNEAFGHIKTGKTFITAADKDVESNMNAYVLIRKPSSASDAKRSGGYIDDSGLNYTIKDKIHQYLPLIYMPWKYYACIVGHGSEMVAIESMDQLHQPLEAKKNELEKYSKEVQFAAKKGGLDAFDLAKDNYGMMLQGSLTLQPTIGVSSTSHPVFRPVSNAWLKLWEIVHEENLIEQQPSGELVSFHNAEYPGSMLIAANHYIRSKTSMKHKWFGSSLIIEQGGTLNDEYGLRAFYPNSWLMNSENNGDVTDVKVLETIRQRIMKETNGKGVDFYTSDIGTGQEKEAEDGEAILNAGQLASCLMTLRKGGNFFTKQFTFFHKYTVSLIALIASVFDCLEIVKPKTSRPSNSEIYLVGKGYHGIEAAADALKLILASISKKDTTTPLVLQVDKTALKCINLAAKELCARNMLFLDRNLSVIEAANTIDRDLFSCVSRTMTDIGRGVVDEWDANYPVTYVDGTIIDEIRTGMLHENNQLSSILTKEKISLISYKKLLDISNNKNFYDLPIIDANLRAEFFQSKNTSTAYERFMLTEGYVFAAREKAKNLIAYIVSTVKDLKNKLFLDMYANFGSDAVHIAKTQQIKVVACATGSFYMLRNNIDVSNSSVYPLYKKDMNVDFVCQFHVVYINMPVKEDSVKILIDDVPLLNYVKELKLRGVEKIIVQAPITYEDKHNYTKVHQLDGRVLCVYE